MSYLRDNFKSIVADINNNDDFFKHNHKIFKCIKGDQLSVLKEAFQKVNSPLARQDKTDLAISLNFIQKIVNKLSQVYTFEVERTANTNQDLVDYYAKSLNVNTVMQNSNELFNGMKSVLVELYLKKDKSLGLRPIPSDRFWVWTDDVTEPNIPSVYIKMIGNCKGLKDKKKTCELYFAYTDTEFLAFDSAGDIREEYNVENDENQLGVAPFIYINKDIYDIVPTPNKDLLQNVIQICSIMTDANVANYYQSFPIRVLINADLESSSIDINPNSVVVLKSSGGPGGAAADFKEIASTLDTSKSINLAKEVLTNLLYTFDISVDGAMTQSTSGLALTIKSTDTLENRKKQIEYFIPAEQELWNKIAIIHNTLIKKNAASPKTPKLTFADDFEIEVDFELPSTEAEQQKEDSNDNKESTDKANQDSVNESKDETDISDTKESKDV